jgi:hypothetical protein
MVRRRVRRVATPMGDLRTSSPRRMDLRSFSGREGRVSSSCYRQDALLHTSSRYAHGEADVDVSFGAAAETLAACSLCGVGLSGHADPVTGRLGRGATTVSQHPLGPPRPQRAPGRRRGIASWVRGSAGPVVRNSVRDNPAQRQVFVGDSRQTSPQRGNTVPLRCYNSMSRCPSGGRGRWGGGGVRGRQRGWRCGRRGVGRR